MAHELYEKSGRIEGRDLDNWLEAEKTVREISASQKKKSASLYKATKKPAKKTTLKKKNQ